MDETDRRGVAGSQYGRLAYAIEAGCGGAEAPVGYVSAPP